MKRFSLLLLISLFAGSLWSVPADRVRLRLRLADGTFVTATAFGDEHYSWFLTDDGEVIEPVEGSAALFRRSGRTPAEASAVSSGRRRAARRIGSQTTAPLPATGSPRVPVVLVNFQDSVFTAGATAEETRAYYDLYCNGTRDGNRYTGHGSYGSIRDYFVQQSDSLFLPEFTIIGPVTLSNPVAHYGRNNGDTKDTGYSEMRREAISLATDMYDGDWSDFDNRGKGQVDLIFFIYAGCGENTVMTNTDLIWAKETTAPVTVTLDDGTRLKFATSACCPEHRRKSFQADGVTVAQVAPDGIGVMCHEFSHALGLPDFYDTNYKALGMDVWSLMDYGCYVSNSLAPVGYTAYERDFMGWRRLEEISEPGPYVLNPICSADGRGLKLVNPENPNEYYVLEARLKSGWDSTLARYGRGMQVTHVDFSSGAWNANVVNTVASHQRMTIIPANNDISGVGFSDAPIAMWAGQLYPYTYEQDGVTLCNDSLTAHSVPAAAVFSASGLMPHTLTEIRIDEDAQQVHFMLDASQYDAVRSIAPAAEASRPAYFDLSGRRVARPARGLYISGGRKVAVVR